MAYLSTRLIAVYFYSVPELATTRQFCAASPTAPTPYLSFHHPLPLQYTVMSLSHTKDDGQLPTSTSLLSVSLGRIATIRGCWRTMT